MPTTATEEAAHHAGPVLVLGTATSPHVIRPAVAMARRGWEVVVAGDCRGAAPAELAEEGIEVRCAPASIRMPILGVAAHVRWVRSLWHEVRPVLVHAHFLSDYAAAAALAGARPLLATVWGSDLLRVGWRSRLVRAAALRRADAISVHTPHLEGVLAKLGVHPSRIRRVRWGVNADLFAFVTPEARAAARRRLGIEQGPVILSPRAVRPLYNPDVVVAAFAEVRAHLPDAQLLMVDAAGDSPVGYGDLPGVRLIPRLPHGEMPALYYAADVCVSVPSSDGSPNSVWEAMAAGCPCVLSRLPWLDGMVTEDEAIVVEPNPRDVAEAVLAVLRDGELAERLRRAGRALVLRDQDEQREMGRLCAVYAELSRGSARRG